jgi:hypothetical protein
MCGYSQILLPKVHVYEKYMLHCKCSTLLILYMVLIAFSLHFVNLAKYVPIALIVVEYAAPTNQRYRDECCIKSG